MPSKIRIGIVGYGNLGKGVEGAIRQQEDMELVAIFTRRDPHSVKSNSTVLALKNVEAYADKIDVMLLCGGSATDILEQAPLLAKKFHTVDSYDTHAKIPEYFKLMDSISQASGLISLISTGWDPGLFSLNRVLSEAVLPQGNDYTFWGRGVSQGHSDAIRRIEGVKDGKQYTIPSKQALERVRKGENPQLSTREKHERVCYVVSEANADLDKISQAIKTMPDYFSDYDTQVHFISEEELASEHSGMPHGGFVIRSAVSANNNKQKIEFNLSLESNPEFTASVMLAYARAVYRLAKEGKKGCLSVFDIPIGYLSPRSPQELRALML